MEINHLTPIIKYKLLTCITHKALHGKAPKYIMDLLMPYNPTRTLRSSGKNFLQKPQFNLTTYGGRSFVVGAPTLWNMLPIDLRSCTTTDTFNKKTENLAF